MVELRLTIAEARGQRDVLIRAASGCRWQQVCAADRSIPAKLFAGHRPVAPDAIVGTPPLVHGALLSTRPAAAPPRHLLELRVVEGMDCGLTVPLGDTDVVVGRGSGADLRLTDAGVSRHHATIRLTAGLVTVADSGSTNGCRIEGRPIGPYAEAHLNVGGHLHVGRTRILLARSGIASVPAQTYPPAEVTVPVPAAPEPPDRRSWPILLATAPLAVSGIAALLLRNPMFLIFAVLSPVMVLSQYLSDRRGGSRGHRRSLVAFRAAVAEAENAVTAALDRERDLRERLTPALGQLIAGSAASPTERDPALGLRVGIGSGPIASHVYRRPEAATAAGATTGPEPLAGAPVDIDLAKLQRLVVTGPQRHRVVDAIAVQLAVCYPAARLRIQVLCLPDRRTRWAWLRMLPHVLADPGGTPAISTQVRQLTRGEEVTVTIFDDLGDGLPDGTMGIVLREEYRPGEASACIETHADGSATVHGVKGLLGRVHLDLAAPGVPERCARALAAGLRVTGRGLPRGVSLGDLYRVECGVDISNSIDVQRLWDNGEDRALTGATADGNFWLDLPTDGPHALIAGTTGSGKSALLQTLLVSWALRQRPERLSFVLVDYKGGAAFSACAQLPHTVGLVTDLDAALTARALTSLQAEIRRREQLLSGAGAADFRGYQRLDPVIPLARLVIVIDEFRALADELPQFVQGLVRVAAVGRSLGIHLILATQRPAGIVSADIRANVDVRIALRTTDRGDSHDVLGTDAAARLDSSTPGRAIVQIAGDSGTQVQIARVRASSHDTPLVRAIDPSTGAPVETAETDDGLSAVVEAIRQAGAVRGGAPPHRPWLPTLPTQVPATVGRDGAVVLGIVDRPEQQKQEAVTWVPADGNLLIVGGPGSGRTTTLVAIALSGGSPTYFVGSTRPAALQAISHIGATVSFDEPARLARLLGWLDERISRVGEEPVRLLVDDWDALQDRSDPESIAVLDRIMRVMREGPRSGVVVVVAGGRAVVSGRVTSLARRRICLTAAGTDDLLLLGVRPGHVSSEQVPGRGILLPDGCEIQCALPGTPPAGAPAAVRFDPLPAFVDACALPPDAFGVGLNGPVGWQPDDRSALIAGPPASGRTTALATMAAQLRRQGVPCWRLDGEDPEAVIRWCAEHPGGVLCVDDLETGAGSAMEQTLLSLNGFRLIGATTTEAAAGAFTGLVGLLRRSGTGLLLRPGRRDGEVFGVTLPTSYDEGPGSAVIVRRGRVSQVRIGRYQDRSHPLL